jgi:peptidoglycan hydrolase-like protein with peptidoglycan-binding domain
MNKALLSSLSIGALLLALAPTAFAALTSVQVQAITSLLKSFGVPTATVSSVEGILNGTGPTTSNGGGSSGSVSGTPSTAPAAACVLNMDLTTGASGDSVNCLQRFLIANNCPIPAGVTGTFGAQTKAALICWQRAKGLPSTGFFGSMSRGLFNKSSVSPYVPPGQGSGYVPPTSNNGGNYSNIDSEFNEILNDVNGLAGDTSNVDSDLGQNDESDE